MKKEFIRRLVRLRYRIDLALEYDDPNFLMPALSSVVSFLWTNHNALNHKCHAKRR